jgi:nicotinamidase-related amidase
VTMPGVWDKFLSEQDKAHLKIVGEGRKIGWGTRPALLLIDNYRGVVGYEREDLLKAAKTNKSAVGLAGWRALEAQQKLLAVGRELDLPIIHITGMAEGNMPGWGYCVSHPEQRGALRGPVPMRAAEYAIVDEVAPTEHEFTLAKVAPSAFWGTPLIALLNFLDVDTLVVGGESTSGCVRASVVDAASCRFRVVIAEECVYDRHEACHAINLFDMNQKYADVLPLQEVLHHLQSAHAVTRASAETEVLR